MQESTLLIVNVHSDSLQSKAENENTSTNVGGIIGGVLGSFIIGLVIGGVVGGAIVFKMTQNYVKSKELFFKIALHFTSLSFMQVSS